MADPETPGTPRSTDREAIAQTLALRFIERGQRRFGDCNWTCLADMPRSYSDDFYADADAILASLPQTGVEARKAIEWLASQQTVGEAMRCPSQEWIDAPVGRRIEMMGKRKRDHDAAVLAARAALTPKVIDRDIEGELREALQRIAWLRPSGDVERCAGAKKIVAQMETIALRALSGSTPSPLRAAANEMLVAFAEGVIWNDGQRAAYEALHSVLSPSLHGDGK